MIQLSSRHRIKLSLSVPSNNKFTHCLGGRIRGAFCYRHGSLCLSFSNTAVGPQQKFPIPRPNHSGINNRSDYELLTTTVFLNYSFMRNLQMRTTALQYSSCDTPVELQYETSTPSQLV